MSQAAVSVRFPDGTWEYRFSTESPRIGDRLKRGDDEWEVIAVEKDTNGNTVVTLGPPGDGQVHPPKTSSNDLSRFTHADVRPDVPESGPELVERAEAVRADATAVRERSVELRRGGEDRRLGQRIAQARQNAGLTQRELAESLRVTVRTIQNYESGNSGPHRHLHEIVALTGATNGWILYGEGVHTPLTERLSAAKKSFRREEEVLAHQLHTMVERIQRLREQLPNGRESPA